MTAAMSFKDSVFMIRNSTPSASSLVRCPIVARLTVRCSAGKLHNTICNTIHFTSHTIVPELRNQEVSEMAKALHIYMMVFKAMA